MRGNKKKELKLWVMMLIATVICTTGSGFYRTLSAGDETYKGLKLFSDVIDLVEKNYVDPVDTKEMIHKAIQGMMQSLDPHSQLLPPEAFEELQIDTKGEFGGIGIVITMQKGALTVISPIEGTPAYNAGIKAGDIIMKVDGEDTKDMMLWEAVKKMRGPQGTKVVISIMRDNNPKLIDFTLVRDIIPIESVKSLIIQPGYGYIRITNFQDNTTTDLDAAISAMEKKDTIKGLILDLRDNPGGLLDQAIKVSDLFLDSGDIVSIKGRLERHTKVFKAHKDRNDRKYPIVVLINAGSASASEIVAGALQDQKRAVILGTTSFGKGSVQTVETLRDGYGLKFTIARYYTPSGRSIQAQGIVPDIEVKQTYQGDTDAEENEDEPIKEKDLKNHLEADPGKSPSTPPTDEKAPKKTPKRKAEFKYGPLDVESLKADIQVMRALEILLSYDVFKNLKAN